MGPLPRSPTRVRRRRWVRAHAGIPYRGLRPRQSSGGLAAAQQLRHPQRAGSPGGGLSDPARTPRGVLSSQDSAPRGRGGRDHRDPPGRVARRVRGSRMDRAGDLLERCPADGGLYFDTVSQVELPDWRSGRVTFAGDACQCVSLLAGQGASLAVAGAFILAEELDRSGDVVQALARYEARLKPRVARMQAAGRRIAEWFVPASKARLVFRDLMLRGSSWPVVAPFLRRGLGADSLFRS